MSVDSSLRSIGSCLCSLLNTGSNKEREKECLLGAKGGEFPELLLLLSVSGKGNDKGRSELERLFGANSGGYCEEILPLSIADKDNENGEDGRKMTQALCLTLELMKDILSFDGRDSSSSLSSENFSKVPAEEEKDNDKTAFEIEIGVAHLLEGEMGGEIEIGVAPLLEGEVGGEEEDEPSKTS